MLHMNHLLFGTTLLAALGAGLMAGSFFAFSSFLLPALKRLAPEAGIAAMQAITASIKRPLFLVVFFATPALAGLLGIVAPLRWHAPGAAWLLAGSLIYLNGAFGVTLMRNVPLNNRLAAVTPGSASGWRLWKDYLPSWTAWNHVRTVSALAAAASLIMALIEGGSPLPARD
jgi:uncharacterized membrane protein